MKDDDIDPEDLHPFRSDKTSLKNCWYCGAQEHDERHDIDEDDYVLNRPAPEEPRFEITYRCKECGFSTSDKPLAEGHNCETEENGGFCIDWPCCGHERGDCNGKKYGSTQSILSFEEKLRRRGYEDYEIDDIFERMH